MLYHELTLAVVGDGRLDGVGLAVVGDAVAGVARDLAQRVGVLAGSGVLDGAHRDLAAGVVLAGGDDIVTLDELEGELAFLEVAPGQELGRGDLVGDTGALGGHRVGILEDRLGGVLQLVLHAKGAVAVVLDDGHDSVLRGAVGNAVFGGAGLGLAQHVGVLASRGVGDGIHHDLAVGIVGAGGDYVIALDELKTELAGLEVTAVQGLDRGNLVGDAGALGARLVGVGKLRLVGALQLMLYAERAVAVVLDDSLDGAGRGIVGDTTDVAPDLAQRVGVLAGLVVLHGVHRDVAFGIVGAGGDDLGVLALTLDELEGELAVLEVAPGQGLGRLDLVGDAGLSGGQIVGILELSGLGILQDVLGLEGAVAVVRDGGLDGELGIAVGDALAGGSALNLAQRVGVLAGLVVGDLAHRDLAASGVLAGSDNLVALDELEGELAGFEVAAGQNLGRLDLVGDAGALGGHVVGVLKLNLLNVLGALQLMRSHQLALAVIADGRHDGVDRIVVGDTAGVACNLMQRVGMLTDLGVLDGVERNVALGVILDSLDKLRVLALNLAQLKAKLVGRKVAPGQGLGHGNLAGNAGLNRIRSISVLELDLARGLLHRSLELSLCVGCHRYGELCNVLAVGDAVDRGPGMLLANLVDIRARLVIGNLAKANVRMALGCKRSRGPGHRGVVLGRQAKLKLVLIRPVAALEHLGQAKVGSYQRCRRGIERKANLAVIAQVDIDLRRTRNNLRVVPLGIDHVACGVRRVSAHTLLGGVKLVDKGEARGASLNRPVIAILYQSTFKVFELASLNRDRNGIIVRRARRVLRHKLIFVPIGLRARRLFRCELGASRVCVDGR